jgi:Fe-S cluster assembly protein SufD
MTTAVKETQDIYLQRFQELEKRAAGRQSPAWLKTLRTDSIRAFAGLGFPTTHLEDWKYTNVQPIAGTAFQPARREANAELAGKLARSPLFKGCSRLVFVNGFFAQELSSLNNFPAKAQVTSLAEALTKAPAPLEEHLGRYADFKQHAFVALNTALTEDGAYVEIPKGLVVESPIQLLYVSTSLAQPHAAHPRNLIVVGQEGQVKVIETHLSLDAGAYFTNAVTEIVAGENSSVDYVKLQQESPAAYHVATVVAHQARSATVETNSIALGALLGREELIAVLAGEGAEALLRGLYVTDGRQLMDNHTTIDHAQPHCSSREFYKGVLDGKSTGVFNGKIIVRPDAQKTDSKQSDKNLLLSEDAVINTKPQLEIFADDVKCTHGATIGQIDAEAIFYLRSRGIGLEEARNLLVVAFAGEIIDRVKFQPLRDRLRAELAARLAQGGGTAASGSGARTNQAAVQEAR